MRRCAFLSLVVLVFGIVASASSSAQPATPEATPVAAEPLDLAALTLRPADLDAMGLTNFGLANISSLRDAETDAIIAAAGNPQEAADRLNLYRIAGFRRRYIASLLRPQVPLVRLRSGLVAAEERVTAAVTEYETEGGAELAFSVTEGSLDDPGLDIPGTRSFGNESDLTRTTPIDPETGNTVHRLELSFRVENLIGEVAITNYINREPQVATVEELAGILLSRISRRHEQPGPGLSERMLRISPLFTWIEKGRVRDFYVRLDGVRMPTFAQIASAIRDGTSFSAQTTPAPAPGTVLPQSIYMYWTPVGDGDPVDLPLYVVWVDRYESSGQAAAALHAITANLGPGYTDVHEFRASERIGEESRAFAYTYEGDPSGPVSGHVAIARAGAIIVRVQVDAADGVRRAGVIGLARLQVDCILASADCSPVPASDVLAELLPGAPRSSASATPEADASPRTRGADDAPGLDVVADTLTSPQTALDRARPFDWTVGSRSRALAG